jgi:peptidoglycan/xylan/chitin deacetylase (PgdA/CDA1 family)
MLSSFGGILRTALYRSIIGAIARARGTTDCQRLSVLIFHRVFRKKDAFFCDDPDAEEFSAIMGVAAEFFTPLSLVDGLSRLSTGTLPPRSICVTFDDGYADNLTVALPILRRLSIPFTVFVASGYLEGRVMWNDAIVEAVRTAPGDKIDLSCYGFGVQPIETVAQRVALARALIRRFKYRPFSEREQLAGRLAQRYVPDLKSAMLTIPQLRSLHAAGAEIGGHTLNHPILALTPTNTAWREIADNKEHLEGLVDRRIDLFAYPNGRPDVDIRPEHAGMVRRAGCGGAVTTQPGVAVADSDPYWLG